MKKIIFAVSVMMFFAVIMSSQAQAAPRFASAGAHGGITAGGDIDSGEPGFGGQAKIMFNKHFGIELALTYFSDELIRYVDLDVTTLGLSAVGSMELAPNLDGYALAGVNYNLFSLSSPYSISVDDDFGFHLGGGVGYKFAENWEVFGEYRFTFLDVDVTARRWGVRETGSADFGMFKFGVNYLF